MLIYEHPFLPEKHPCQSHHSSLDDALLDVSCWSRLRVFESDDRCPHAPRSQTGGRMFVYETVEIPMNGVRLNKEHSNESYCTCGVRTILHGGA